MFRESAVPVSAHPAVELFVAQTPGPAANPLLVIHGGPDWDHTYLREPLGRLAGFARFFSGLEMVEPGIVPLPQWGRPGSEHPIPCYAGMGRKPLLS